MRNEPNISVGIVVYNGVDHIRTALESVVNQTYGNVELIVVDGGSTDGTLKILDEYSEKISKLVSETDAGVYDAMNKVCSLATGDWLIFLGCDDVLLGALAKIAEKLVQPDSVYYGDVILKSRGSVHGGRFSKLRIVQMNICHQAIFYPRRVYKKYSYNLKYRWLADYEYNIILMAAGVPLIYTEEIVSIFDDKGASSFGDEEFSRDKLRIIRQSFGIKYAVACAFLTAFRNMVPDPIKQIVRRLA